MCDSLFWHTSIPMSSDSSMSSTIPKSFAPHFNGKVTEIRAMGYNLFSCILELTDNSISTTCGSKTVRVIMYFKDQRLHRITIMDDGVGMSIRQLCEAIILNLIKAREVGDIGKFHVGMKYALITMGSEIIIISKKEHSQTVGIRMNIDQMQEHDTFEPTEICDAVDDTWARRYVTSSQYEQFKKYASGTFIEVRNLVQSYRTNQQKILEDVAKNLSLSYTNIPANCHISVESQIHTKGIETAIKVFKKIEPFDLFYTEAPQCLDERAYSTTLTLYRHEDGVRLIETIQQSRKIGAKKETGGEPLKPLFFEHKEVEKSRKSKNGIIVKKMGIEFIPIAKKDLLSMKEDRIDVLDVTVIQVNDSTHIKEKELFSEDSKLLGDRKGLYFLRDGIRCVGSAKQLGYKLHDRATSSCERQRMQVRFTSNSDEHVGSTFNKQMPDHALPCSVLNSALMNIYKQVTTPWSNKWAPLDAAEKARKAAEKGVRQKSDSEEESEEESDEESDEKNDSEKVEQPDSVEAFELHGPNVVVVPLSESSATKPSGELNESSAAKPAEVVVKPSEVLNEEPAAKEPASEVSAAEDPAAEEPAAKEPAAEEPAAEDADAEDADAEEAAAKEAAEEAAAKEAAAKEAAAKEAAEEAAAEEPIEVEEEEMPQFDEDVPEFEQPLIPRKNVVTFDLTHFTNEQYEHFKEMAEIFGLII